MADNTLASARNLGSLKGTKRLQNSLSNRDKVDFYQIKLSGRSAFSMTLRSSKRSNFSLLDGKGAVIAQIKASDNRATKLSRTLEVGTYFVRVRSGGRDPISYSLTASATSVGTTPPVPVPPAPVPPVPPVPPAPPAAPTTIDLGSFTGNQAFQNQTLNKPDNVADFYRFTLPQLGSFNATVSNLTGSSVGLRLYADSNGNGVGDSNESVLSGSASSSSNDPISTTALPAGNYIVEVNSSLFSGATKYDLTLATIPNPSSLPTDPGSEPPTAFALGSLPGTLVAKDYVGRLDAVDMYRFTVGSTLNASINVGNLSDDSVQVTLFRDINGNNLIDSGERVTGDSFRSNVVNSAINRLLVAGSYFVSVDRGIGGDSAYTLTVQA
jgi:Bacterial pre-peptidase C-terminal domain